MIDALVTLATLLLKWNALLIVASFIPLALSASLRTRRWLTFSSLQTIHRLALATALSGPIIAELAALFIQPTNVFRPGIQVATSNTLNGATTLLTAIPQTIINPYSSNAEIAKHTGWIAVAAGILLFITFASAAFRIFQLISDRTKLHQELQRSYLFRRVGKVQVLISESVQVPFTALIGLRPAIFLPKHLLADWQNLKLVLRHEFQHHRQKDLLWNFFLEAARLICGWNPIVLHWMNRIEENDEFACDEVLLGRQRFDSLAYATCLYEVARAVQQTRGAMTTRLAGTAGMAVSPHFLKRRIEMIFQKTPTKSRLVIAMLAVAITSTTALASWASKGLVSDRRVSESEAVELAKKTQTQTGIPVVINKQVLDCLNMIVSNPRARLYVRNTLKRMTQYEGMITAKIAAAGLTNDLLAVPAIESGFQNTENPISAGIWMFIPQTARNYGLRVDDTIDERLNPERETDAAMAYLGHLHRLFNGDWLLALLSYNVGESRVKAIIKEAGHRDVFRMAEEGRLPKAENAHYVPKIIAALIILKNPDLVKE